MLPWVSRRRHEREVRRFDGEHQARLRLLHNARRWLGERDQARRERNEARGERDAALSRVVELEQAIRIVLRDEETGAGGWGPDVTMADVLRSALDGHERQDPDGFRVEDHADVPDNVKLAPEPDNRAAECVERWPECETGTYDPRCCRFPKSCSADVHREG